MTEKIEKKLLKTLSVKNPEGSEYKYTTIARYEESDYGRSWNIPPEGKAKLSELLRDKDNWSSIIEFDEAGKEVKKAVQDVQKSMAADPDEVPF